MSTPPAASVALTESCAAPGVAPLPACAAVGPDELEPVWARIPKAAIPVARRDLSTYDAVGAVA